MSETIIFRCKPAGKAEGNPVIEFLKEPNLFEASKENKKSIRLERRFGLSIFGRELRGKAQPI
ncbi:MAG: hypothetical protein R3209_10645, partial [Salinimicrobium sediminis]|nr:hypothetical protein [Salinimicrobium sediminis]